MGLLALFYSSYSSAADCSNQGSQFYSNQSSAYSAAQTIASQCNFNIQNSSSQIDGLSYKYYYVQFFGNTRGRYYYLADNSGCPPDRYEYPDGSCKLEPPPLTDEECQNTDFTAYATIDISSGSAPKNMNYGGCSFSLTYDIQSDDDVANKCRIDNSNSNIIVCPVSAKGSASTNEANTEGFSDIVPVGDYVESKGGDESVTNSQSPITTTADLPEIGDTTNEFTKSEAVTTARKDEIYNNGDGVKYKSESEYLQINTEMVQEVIKANGDVETTKTETHEKTEQTINETKIDKDGNVTQEQSKVPPQTGSTTTVTNNYVDGSTTTNVTNTGVGGDGKAQDNIKEGNCAPGEECKVTLDESGVDEAGAKSQISGALSELKTKRDGVLSDLSSDGDSDYGLSGVAGFGANNFITRYLELPSSTCSGGINTTIFGRPFVIEPCDKLQPLRDVLAWVFFILTFFTCIKILLNTRSI